MINQTHPTISNTLKAVSLSKSYGSKQVVKDLSLSIKTGEIVGLLGPNGAGKTTCFHMIVGLVCCDQGEVFLNEENLTHQPLYERARSGMAYLSQEPSIFRKLTVEKNLLAILELSSLSAKERFDKLNKLIGEFNLEAVRHTLGIQLSGGERRRVEIARSVSLDPKFILLDEPFASIDPISISSLKKLIIHLKERGIGVLITDHDVRNTLELCDRAYILYDGSLLTQGSPQTIANNQTVKNVYLGKEFNLY